MTEETQALAPVPLIALSTDEARFVARPPISVRVLARALATGELVAHRVGVNAYITIAELTRWIEAQENFRDRRNPNPRRKEKPNG